MSGSQVIEIGSFLTFLRCFPVTLWTGENTFEFVLLCWTRLRASFIFISYWRAIANDAKKRKKHHLYSIHKCVPYQILFYAFRTNLWLMWNIQKPQMLQRFGLTGSIFDGYVKGIRSVPNSQTVWVLDYWDSHIK